MHGTQYLQMADFMSSDDNSRETAGVFDDGHAVDFLQTLVDDASSADVCESCSVFAVFLPKFHNDIHNSREQKTQRHNTKKVIVSKPLKQQFRLQLEINVLEKKRKEKKGNTRKKNENANKGNERTAKEDKI